jgi:rhomboid protease GluP
MAIIAVCVAFFIGQQLIPGLTNRLAAFEPAIADGQWWRLLTPMVLHAPRTFWHIALNMYVLFLYGPDVERAFGAPRFIAMFVITGFTGNAASYAFGPCPTLGVGASGAIFGIVGGLLVWLYNRRRSAFVTGHLRGILGFIALNLVIGFAIPGIDYIAHLGGLAGGVLVGAGFDRGPQSSRITGVQIATACGVVALGIALVLWRTATFTCGGFG